MFKLISMALILSSCTIIGFYKTFEIKHRKEILIEFQELMLKISTEMGYFREPLPILFERLITDENTHANILLRQCCIGYHQNIKSFDSLWGDALAFTYRNEPLNDDNLQIMYRCGKFLGQSDFHSQKAHFELFQQQISKEIQKAEEEIKTKAGLYCKAGLSVGAVLAIVII